MIRRFTNVDYDNIFTYAEEHGRGSIGILAKTYGVSKQHIGLIITAYRSIVNDLPIRNKAILKLPLLLRSAKEYKFRIFGTVYHVADNSSKVNVSTADMCDNVSNNISFIDEYINKNRSEIEDLRKRIATLEDNIRVATEFAKCLD